MCICVLVCKLIYTIFKFWAHGQIDYELIAISLRWTYLVLRNTT